MSFGITDEGFVTKRLEDIKDEIEQSLKTSLGVNINLLPNSVMGQIVGIFSERESLLWELMEAIFNSQYPSTASGQILDLVCQLTGITRLGATKSIVTLRLEGTEGVSIPAGSQVARNDDNSIVFETSSIAVIDDGINEVQTISFNIVPNGGTFTLGFNGNDTAVLGSSSTASNVETALNNLPDLSSVVVAGDFSSGFVVIFANIDGKKPQSQISVSSNSLVDGATPVTITVETNTEGDVPKAIVEAQSLTAGEIPAPATTLSEILTPVSGWDTATNEVDAVLGREEETDAELKLRRDQTLQIAGAATSDAIFAQLSNVPGVEAVRVFENLTEIVDQEGRPPKSYEAVVQGGDEDEIAQTVWDTKPAGIRTVGTVVKNIIDSQNFTQEVKFSRPDEQDIYLEVDLAVTNLFPANGATLAQEALLEFGNSLGIGEDVIVYPQLICALNNIPGITNVIIRIGTSPSPTEDDNIIIDENEISAWESNRIDITIL